jgi:GNAT superfamily N-acetyltransferase
MPSTLRFVELRARSADLDLLREFYDGLYTHEFPDADERESYDNMVGYLREVGSSANGYHIVLALREDSIVGASISDYFAGSNAGVVEFIVVAPHRREQGDGTRLLRETEHLLAADAVRAGRELGCVMAEINDPFKQASTRDSLDPFRRAMWWSRRDYGRLAFPYVQPPLSSEQSAVEQLMLCARSLRPDGQPFMPAVEVAAFVRDYLVYAMRITDPGSSPEYVAMERWLSARDYVAIQNLAAYVGHDPTRPLVVHEVCGPHDARLNGVLAVYSASFTDSATGIAPDQFRVALATRQQDPAQHYHLWALEEQATSSISGMVSFFTLPTAGFGGYIAMTPPLRGTGRLASVLARVERQMLSDSSTLTGWYIECEEASTASLFVAHGFFEIETTYCQPSLAPGREQTRGPVLHLLYKEFGARYTRPRLRPGAFLQVMREVFRHVYDVAEVDTHPAFRSLAAAASTWQEVPFTSPTHASC